MLRVGRISAWRRSWDGAAFAAVVGVTRLALGLTLPDVVVGGTTGAALTVRSAGSKSRELPLGVLGACLAYAVRCVARCCIPGRMTCSGARNVDTAGNSPLILWAPETPLAFVLTLCKLHGEL
jgi:hypothetical protein